MKETTEKTVRRSQIPPPDPWILRWVCASLRHDLRPTSQTSAAVAAVQKQQFYVQTSGTGGESRVVEVSDGTHQLSARLAPGALLPEGSGTATEKTAAVVQLEGVTVAARLDRFPPAVELRTQHWKPLGDSEGWSAAAAIQEEREVLDLLDMLSTRVQLSGLVGGGYARAGEELVDLLDRSRQERFVPREVPALVNQDEELDDETVDTQTQVQEGLTFEDARVEYSESVGSEPEAGRVEDVREDSSSRAQREDLCAGEGAVTAQEQPLPSSLPIGFDVFETQPDTGFETDEESGVAVRYGGMAVEPSGAATGALLNNMEERQRQPCANTEPPKTRNAEEQQRGPMETPKPAIVRDPLHECEDPQLSEAPDARNTQEQLRGTTEADTGIQVDPGPAIVRDPLQEYCHPQFSEVPDSRNTQEQHRGAAGAGTGTQVDPGPAIAGDPLQEYREPKSSTALDARNRQERGAAEKDTGTQVDPRSAIVGEPLQEHSDPQLSETPDAQSRDEVGAAKKHNGTQVDPGPTTVRNPQQERGDPQSATLSNPVPEDRQNGEQVQREPVCRVDNEGSGGRRGDDRLVEENVNDIHPTLDDDSRPRTNVEDGASLREPLRDVNRSMTLEDDAPRSEDRRGEQEKVRRPPESEPDAIRLEQESAIQNENTDWPQGRTKRANSRENTEVVPRSPSSSQKAKKRRRSASGEENADTPDPDGVDEISTPMFALNPDELRDSALRSEQMLEHTVRVQRRMNDFKQSCRVQ